MADKLADYHRLAHATGLVTPVLFWFPTQEREDNARAALATVLTGLVTQPGQPGALVPVATTRSLPVDPFRPTRAGVVPDSPAGARWLPLNPASTTPSAAPRGATGRVRLAQLTAAWPALARPAALTDGQPASSPWAARASRTQLARRGSAAASTRSWPAPAAMPPDPDNPSLGRSTRATV